MVALATARAALAWSRPGHMVTTAIAYRELAARQPDRLRELLDILAAHPDRAPFEVAVDRATGEEKQRRVFYECARWPDDARGTPYDHPTWHYSARPVERGVTSGKTGQTMVSGAAGEAFALNLNVLNDPLAPKPDRAVALCWIMHLIGDIHQPLHNAQLFSPSFPTGDRLGSLQFVRERAESDPVTLHWLWDDRVQRSGSVGDVDSTATRIANLPGPAQVEDRSGGPVAAFGRWSAESYAIADREVYSTDLRTSAAAGSAPVVPSRYWASTGATTEERVRLAGLRLAWVLSGKSAE